MGMLAFLEERREIEAVIWTIIGTESSAADKDQLTMIN